MELKLVVELNAEHSYQLFGVLGKWIISEAKADELAEETRMLLTLSCEGILEALSAAPQKSAVIACPGCGRSAPVPETPANVICDRHRPQYHNVILSSSGPKLCCDCGYHLGRWDEGRERWIVSDPLPPNQLPGTYRKAVRTLLSNQAKLLVAIRDAFSVRDSLIELISILQKSEVLEEEDFGDSRHLLSMQPLPQRAYREFIAREQEVNLAQEEIDG